MSNSGKSQTNTKGYLKTFDSMVPIAKDLMTSSVAYGEGHRGITHQTPNHLMRFLPPFYLLSDEDNVQAPDAELEKYLGKSGLFAASDDADKVVERVQKWSKTLSRWCTSAAAISVEGLDPEITDKALIRRVIMTVDLLIIGGGPENYDRSDYSSGLISLALDRIADRQKATMLLGKFNLKSYGALDALRKYVDKGLLGG